MASGKVLVLVVLCGLLVTVMFFGAYQLGLSKGKDNGTPAQNDPIVEGQYNIGFQKGNSTGYAHGYQDGLNAANGGG